MIGQVERYVHVMVQLDASRINSRNHLHHMNTLEQWNRDGVIMMDMSEVAQNEACADKDPKRTEKASSYIYSKTMAGPAEWERMSQIEKLIFPSGARTDSERRDVEIVLNAWKYGSILVTADGASRSQPRGILGAKEELRALGIRVMTDEEAVFYIRERLRRRDEMAQERHEKFGHDLPSWAGKD